MTTIAAVRANADSTVMELARFLKLTRFLNDSSLFSILLGGFFVLSGKSFIKMKSRILTQPPESNRRTTLSIGAAVTLVIAQFVVAVPAVTDRWAIHSTRLSQD